MLTRDSQPKQGKLFSGFYSAKTSKKLAVKPQSQLQLCVVNKPEISEFRRGAKQALQIISNYES